MTALGSTGLDVFPLCLGANVFGWTADEDASYAVLGPLRRGGRKLHRHRQPVLVLGARQPRRRVGGDHRPLAGEPRRRDELVLATKVGGEMPGLPRDLRASTIRRAIDESLQRLHTDRVDVYYAHFDDAATPLEETMEAFTELVRAGKALQIGFLQLLARAARGGGWRSASARTLSRFACCSRSTTSSSATSRPTSSPLCEAHGIAAVPYFGIAMGFLTGKYRPGGAVVDSPRAEGAAAYLEDRKAVRVLEALDEIAAARGAALATVALAWLRTRATVARPDRQRARRRPARRPAGGRRARARRRRGRAPRRRLRVRLRRGAASPRPVSRRARARRRSARARARA